MIMETRPDAIARLEAELADCRPDEAPQFLIEFLAEWGPEHLDVQPLAELVLARQED